MNSETVPIHTKIEQSLMGNMSPLPSHRSNQFATQRDRFNRTANNMTYTKASNGKSPLGKSIHKQLASIQVGISDLYQQSC